MVALMDGKLVAGALSYNAYNEGVEIEIDMREDQ